MNTKTLPELNLYFLEYTFNYLIDQHTYRFSVGGSDMEISVDLQGREGHTIEAAEFQISRRFKGGMNVSFDRRGYASL